MSKINMLLFDIKDSKFWIILEFSYILFSHLIKSGYTFKKLNK